MKENIERIDELLKRYEENFRRLRDDDHAAKEAGTIVGRYIREPFADGAAFYKVIKENKRTVRIKVVTGIGDDWMLPYWGAEATIDKAYAVRNIDARDGLEEIFAKQSAKQKEKEKEKEAAPCA